MSAVAVAPARVAAEPVLEVRDLVKTFHVTRGHVRRDEGSVQAVSGVSFSVPQGGTLGLVGESGCGKSTVARCVVRLLDPDSGEVSFRPGGGDAIDVLGARGEQLRQFRRKVQIVFQDPYSSLSPRMSVGDILMEPLSVHRVGSRADRRRRVGKLLELVGLTREHAGRYPSEFSGGQRQRIAIARALALNPSLLVLDEPVSSLDVSVQAQVLNLLQDLQRELGLSFLFIAHDLAIVRHVSDEVAVMYLGKIVERADRSALYAQPLHPYTRALLSAVPVPDCAAERERQPLPLRPGAASAAAPPSGCRFHPRCPIADAPGVCSDVEPVLEELAPGRAAACHFAGAPRS